MSNMTQSSVDEYIAGFEGEAKRRLETMRCTILEIAPDATESISYGMPAYKLYGKPLVYFGGYPHHIGFYAVPNTHEAFAADLANYKQGRGSVQFPHDQALPVTLVQRMTAFRVKELSS